MNKYLKRCIDTRLKDKLASSGAVWIKGPKWCVKSTTAEQIAKSLVDDQKMKKPDFLMVITATEYAYQRDDGVWIVPLACLKD